MWMKSRGSMHGRYIAYDRARFASGRYEGLSVTSQ